MAKKNALGRGLGALIEDADEKKTNTLASSIQEIKLDEIRPNPYQPRLEFDDEALKDLAASIKSIGIVQPITVRVAEDGKYELVAGERRFRASKLAGCETITAYIRNNDDASMLEMALVENIQREDLNSIEIAISYQRLIDECKLTHEQLSERVGKNRVTITNYLRLLKLPAPIQLALRDKRITMGHARAIINVEDPDTQNMIFEQIIKYDFSVRKVEEIVRELLNASEEASQKKPEKEDEKTEEKIVQSNDYDKLQDHLSDFFSTKVELKRNPKGKGKIVINFKSDNELEKILSILEK